jgi:hypothetical protein
MSRRSAIHVEALRERYPIGNDASQLTIHIYQDRERAWELTELRLKFWAAGIVRNDSFWPSDSSKHVNMQASRTTTMEKPPVSNHFSDTQKLWAALQPVQPQLSPPQLNYQAHYAAMQLLFQQYPPQFGFQHYPYPQPNPGFLSHHGHHMQPVPHFNNLAAPHHEEPVIKSPGTALRLRVPLTNFCTRYFISDSDQQKLQELEYRPGDKLVENLEEKGWKEFSTLGWQGFLAAHRQFCEDVKKICGTQSLGDSFYS